RTMFIYDHVFAASQADPAGKRDFPAGFLRPAAGSKSVHTRQAAGGRTRRRGWIVSRAMGRVASGPQRPGRGAVARPIAENQSESRAIAAQKRAFGPN